MSFCSLSDGRKLYFRETGSGKPLVLLHGWSMSSAVFQEVSRLLSKNFRVLAPDLTGHGASDSISHHLNLDVLATDIEEWLAQLQIDSINLLGWSLGGQVALQLQQRNQVGIEKLILVATTPLFVETDDWSYGLAPAQVRAMDRQLQRSYERSMSDFFGLMFAGENVNRDRYREIIRFAVRDGSLPESEVARSGLKILSSTDLRQLLAGMNLPVLVHYGSLDQITSPSACQFLTDALPLADGICWEGVGHAPFLSRPDESASLWQAFLQ